MWRLNLPYETPPMSLNKRIHYQVRAALTRQIHNDVLQLARAAKIPRGLDHVTYVLYWQVANRIRRDTDNPVPTHKAVVDALTKYGVTASDSMEHVTGVMPQIVYEPAGPFRMWMEIYHGDVRELLTQLQGPL